MRWSKTLDAGSIDADKLQHTILFQTMDMDSDVNSKMSSHDMDDKEDEEALLKAQTTELVEEPDPQHTMVMTPQYLQLERSEVDGHPPGTQVVKVNANGQVVSCEMIPHVGSIDGDQHGLVVHVLPTSHGDLKDGTTYYTPATTQQLQRAGALITDERFLTEQLTTQHYEDDLLSHDLTDDDRRLAAALMAVQYSQQQKQQQNIAKLLEPGSIVTEGNVIMSVSDTMQSLISTNQLGKVVTDPTQGSMSDMVVEYIQQVEGTSSSSDRKQMRLVTYHTDGQTIHTTDAAQLQAIDESQLQTQVSPITHTPAKKIATTQMSPRARYKRLLEESQGHIVTGVRESAESAREAIVQKNEDEEEFDTDDDLNDSDYDVESGNRSSRRSLPHKKRIPRKLKNVNKKTTGQDKVFKCIKCDETFQTQNALTVHKQLHKNNKLLFNCEICGKPSPNQLQFFEHLKSHYEPPKDLQNDTGMQSMEQVLIDDTSIKEEEHIQSVSQILPPALPPPLACTQCGKIFRRQKALEKHVSTAHCQVEDVLEEIEEEEDEDMIDHSELLPEEMEDESLKKGGEWYTHHELTAVPVQHVMEQVEHKLETTEDGHHVLTEIAVSELQPVMEEISTGHLCDHCGENFELKSQLTLHMKEEHPEIKRKTRNAKKEIAVTDSATATTAAATGEKVSKKWEQLTCPTCGRMFNHRNSLVYHLRSHTGERPHQCEVCGKSFFAASALKVHMRLHSGDKPYKCELCGRHFRQWGDLKYHCISIHTDEKQYQCEYCGKDFARKYSLIVHRRIHTGEKNYKCEFCNKTFRASSYLQNHRRIHTGEKPHPCDVCGKPFRVRSDMKRHMQTHTRDTGGGSHHHHQSVSAVTHAVVLSQSSQSSSQGGMDLSELDPVAAEITIQDGDRDEAAAASAALAQEQDAPQQITEVAGEDVQEEVMQQYSRDPLETLKTYIVIPYM